MNNEYAEAVTASSLKIYTRIGIERIDPPPPIRPRISPTKTENKYPNHSIGTSARGVCDPAQNYILLKSTMNASGYFCLISDRNCSDLSQLQNGPRIRP